MNASAERFFATRTAQRDAAGFATACRRPDTLTDAAIDVLFTRRKTLSRVLVVDGRCLCKNNGIGNLFGDYVTWFTVALLSDRAIYIDWTDSTMPRLYRLGSTHYDMNTCMARRSGNVCNRVGRRFDLGAHFSAMDDGPTMSWQWTETARSRVEAMHGSASERVLMARNASDPLSCDALTDSLLGPSPWVTVRVSDETSIALIPLCISLRKREQLAAKGVGATEVKAHRRGYPDAYSSYRLFGAFHANLVRAGRMAAARTLDEQVLRRAHTTSVTAAEPKFMRIGQSLWSAPLGQVLEWPKSNGEWRATLVAALRAERGVGVISPSPSRNGRGQRRRKGARVSSDPPGSLGVGVGVGAFGRGELPALGMLTSCILHAMVRPRGHLRAHLTPLLERVGSASLVTLQLRTGWADDTQEIGLHLAEMLAAPPADVQAALVSKPERSPPARLAGHLYKGFTPCLASGGQASCREQRKLMAPLRYVAPLAPHFEGTPAAVAAARWRTLTATPCMRMNAGGDGAYTRRQRSRADEILDECLSPTPHALYGALQAQLQASEVVDAPRALRDFRSGVRDPVHLPYVNQSKLALAVSCAARLAQAHAHERVWRRVGAAPRSWKLYVSSDSPAVRSLLEQLPELRGHVIGCFPLRCTHPSLRGGSWRTPSEDQTLALATDLWMLGAADATMAVSSTTLVYWSTRSPPRDGRTQWLSRSPVPTLGNKMVPVCAGSTPTDECPDAKPNYDRFCCGNDVSGTRCLAMRFSLFSEAAAFAFAPAE